MCRFIVIFPMHREGIYLVLVNALSLSLSIFKDACVCEKEYIIRVKFNTI